MATNKRTLSRIGFYCELALFLIITLFPFFVMLMTSFKGAKEAISLHPTLLPQQWTLEHYVDIFNPMIFPFVDYFRNRGAITVAFNGITHLAAVIGLLAKRIAKESTWLSFRYNIFKKSTITRCMW
ncbi:inner membrane ABC transporter permease YcjP [Escherichia coli]|nr:inner membrane ABC transporter permease YcjP [Escherichia coli]